MIRLSIRSIAAGLALHLAVAGAYAAEAPPPAKKRVAILLFEGVEIIDYSGPYEVLAEAGYDVFTVAASRQPVHTASGPGIALVPKYTFADAPAADIVLVPGGGVQDPSKDAATLDWVRRESAGAQHTMSVCNGAFILAATGLLDGLTATTTWPLIDSLRASYPKVNVVSDQRYIDNGKFLTTAGLSAGIDGALHLIEVMDGADQAQTVAMTQEYDWHREGGFVRGLMADRVLPWVMAKQFGKMVSYVDKGDKEHWEQRIMLSSSLTADQLFAQFKGAYQDAYRKDGAWKAGSFHVADAGARTAAMRVEDRDGRQWNMALSIEPQAGKAEQFVVKVVNDRAAQS